MVRRARALALVAAITAPLLAGCSEAGDGDGRRPSPASSRPATSSTPPSAAAPTSSASDLGEPADPVSLAALARTPLDGADLTLGAEVAGGPNHRQYDVTYRSGDLTVSGRLAVPRGDGPFPAVVLAHGYIDPAVYRVGQGMTRERAWLAERGYVVLHADYRGHGDSDPDPSRGEDLRMGYTLDVLNAVEALRAWSGPVDDGRVALVGRSMGGGVVYNALVARPGLVDAGVAFAPVSSDAVDNFERWMRPDTAGAAVLRRHGEPAANPDFWAGVSARTYFSAITEPVLIHHGTADDVCPPRWSRETEAAMRTAGVEVTLREYRGEQHAFGPQFDASMRRTEDFLRAHLT